MNGLKFLFIYLCIRPRACANKAKRSGKAQNNEVISLLFPANYKYNNFYEIVILITVQDERSVRVAFDCPLLNKQTLTCYSDLKLKNPFYRLIKLNASVKNKVEDRLFIKRWIQKCSMVKPT